MKKFLIDSNDYIASIYYHDEHYYVTTAITNALAMAAQDHILCSRVFLSIASIQSLLAYCPQYKASWIGWYARAEEGANFSWNNLRIE